MRMENLVLVKRDLAETFAIATQLLHVIVTGNVRWMGFANAMRISVEMIAVILMPPINQILWLFPRSYYF